MKIIHVVGAAIFDDAARCLITQRSANMSNPLLWEFPGGKLEPGESPEEALRREIAEELNLIIRVGAFIARGEAHLTDAVTIRLDVYHAKISGGTLCLHEHAAHRWCAPSSFKQYAFAEADWPAVNVLTAGP